MKNTKGFTLVELLAVIAILAILVIIALPNVMGMFNQAKENSFTTELKQIYKIAQQTWMNDSMFNTGIKEYGRCDGCPFKELDLSGRNELKYYIKISQSGKIIKFYATDGSYQYKYDGENLNVEDIKKVDSVADLNENQKLVLDANNINIVEPTSTSCFTYETENNEITITGYDSSCPNDVVIPSKIDNLPVTILNDESFNSMGLTSVILPNTLKHIYGFDTNGVFAHNNLTSIVLPEGLETIGDYAFYKNQITSVIIPSSVTDMGEAVFYGNKIKSVTINSSGHIGYGTFANNEIDTLIFGDSAHDIRITSHAFEDNNLTSLNLPDSVILIGDLAFAKNNIKTLSIPNSVTTCSASAFRDNEIDSAYIDMSYITSYLFSSMGGGSDINLKSLTLGEHVQRIGKWAFNEGSITTITIPSSVTYIDDGAFSSNQIKTVIVKGKTSSSQFEHWNNSIFGWASDITCTKDNTSNVTNGCITWEG